MRIKCTLPRGVAVQGATHEFLVCPVHKYVHAYTDMLLKDGSRFIGNVTANESVCLSYSSSSATKEPVVLQVLTSDVCI